MEAISFKLDVFEGPLDLMLHLISKHKLNINDIEISKLLEQYMIYIEQAKEQDLELSGEFLKWRQGWFISRQFRCCKAGRS